MSKPKKIDTSAMIEVYKTQWLDIHHSRSQDWEMSKVILVGFITISGLQAFTNTPLLLLILSGSFVVVCVLAILITIRHKVLFREKMRAIRILETELGLNPLNLFELKQKYRSFTTQNLLIVVYLLSAIIFGTFFTLQIIP